MKRTFLRRSAVAAATVALLASALVPPVLAAERQRGAMVDVLLGTHSTPSFVLPPAETGPVPEAARFTVTYTGFTSAARAAFQRAVNIWAAQLNSPVTTTVSASFSPLPTGVLGSAGPNFVWRDFPGFIPGTWYPDALANKKRGVQLNASPDIIAQFSSSFTAWHFGSGPAPAGKIDFTAVVLHELGHGLGFAAARSVSSSGVGSVRLVGFPFIYTRFVENNPGASILSFADPSTALGNQLRGGNLFFDSPQVRAANGNVRAKLFAPAVFVPGSSFVHLDEATYLQGNANSLMTPSINRAETIRNPGPIALAILRTQGW